MITLLPSIPEQFKTLIVMKSLQLKVILLYLPDV
jgi:hypothetical protein